MLCAVCLDRSFMPHSVVDFPSIVRICALHNVSDDRMPVWFDMEKGTPAARKEPPPTGRQTPRTLPCLRPSDCSYPENTVEKREYEYRYYASRGMTNHTPSTH